MSKSIKAVASVNVFVSKKELIKQACNQRKTKRLKRVLWSEA